MRERFSSYQPDANNQERLITSLIRAWNEPHSESLDQDDFKDHFWRIVASTVDELSQSLLLRACYFYVLPEEDIPLPMNMGIRTSTESLEPCIQINPPYIRRIYSLLGSTNPIAKSYGEWRLKASLAHEYEHERVNTFNRAESSKQSARGLNGSILSREEYAADLLALMYLKSKNEKNLLRKIGKSLVHFELTTKLLLRILLRKIAK